MRAIARIMWVMIAGMRVAAAAEPAPATTAVPLMQRALSGIAGKEALLLEVNIPPGGASAAHRHDADVFVYVLEGSVIMQVAGGEPQTLGAGQTFFENPGDIHVRSENASKTAPAKLLVFFVKNRGAPATRPAPSTQEKTP